MVQELYGTGLQLPEFDAEQSGEESVWREDADAPTAVCASCAGQRLKSRGSPCAVSPTLDRPRCTNLPGAGFCRTSSQAEIGWPRARYRARYCWRRLSARHHFSMRCRTGYLQLNRAAPTPVRRRERNAFGLTAHIGIQSAGRVLTCWMNLRSLAFRAKCHAAEYFGSAAGQRKHNWLWWQHDETPFAAQIM